MGRALGASSVSWRVFPQLDQGFPGEENVGQSAAIRRTATLSFVVLVLEPSYHLRCNRRDWQGGVFCRNVLLVLY